MPSSGGSSGGGGLPLSGGTLTGELIVDTAAASGQALELTGTRTGGQEVFGIDYPHQVVDITSDGVALIQSDDNMAATVRGTNNTGASLEVVNQLADTSDSQFVTLNAGNANQPLINANNQGDGNALLTLTGAAAFKVQADGTPRLNAHAAPGASALSAGECALWFDQTAGASKLMIQAKSANGTLVSGSVSLA